MTIQVTLNANEFERTGIYNDREYTSLRIDRISNGRVYFTTIKDNMRWSTMAKQMKLDNGNVIISFGKNDKLIIGTYTDTEVIEEVSEQETVTNDTQSNEEAEEVVTIDYSGLYGYGQGVAYRDNRNDNNTMTYFNPKGNESITIRVWHDDYDKYWEIQNFIYSIMKQYGNDPSFWSILMDELDNKYFNVNKHLETKQETKKETVCEPIQKVDMIADYAEIIYSNNKAIITFTNNKESNIVTFNYRKSWSHRKYIDKALEQSGIKPSWEFRYGWEYKAV
jgi:hypothetical protein